jgi:hypothetical protein
MAKLTIEFNCMCMFVPNPAKGSVHVLMPVTAHGGHPAHEVRIRHRSFTKNEDEKKEGRLMEGLELVLRGRGAADTALTPSQPSDPQGELPDLSKIAGSKPVDPVLLTSLNPSGVVSRVTLLSGKVGEIRAHGKTWHLGGKDRVLAFQVTWTIDDVHEELEWHPLHDSGATVPLASLRDLTPEDGTYDYRIEIHHVLKGTLITPSTLTAEQVRHHFEAFYTPLDVANPTGDLLPDPVDDGFEGSPDFKCVGVQASLA